MAVTEGGTSGALAEVGVPAAGQIGTNLAQHVTLKGIPYGTLGHYRLTLRSLSDAAQAANARIFELRNTGTNLIIPTRLTLRAMQVAAGTAQENSIDCYRVTGFTAVDTTNTSTPVASVKRTGMGAAPGNVALRTKTANAAGMTGGALTKDTTAFASLPYNVAAAINTTTIWGPLDALDDVNGTHPFVFAQNEGFIIENRVLNVTSYGIAWFIDISYAEVAAF